MSRELLEKQLRFLGKVRREAEKASAVFESEMKQFKKGEYFNSAKNACARVRQRIKDIDKMVLRVQREIAELPAEAKPKKKEKKAKQAKKHKKLKKKAKKRKGK